MGAEPDSSAMSMKPSSHSKRLKRPDEKFVTEQAYDNALFVEDVVRNVATRLEQHAHVTWFRVEVESEESIHGHNAFASIERSVNRA